MAGVLAALAMSGCSYLVVDRPPKAIRRGDASPDCTTGKASAYLDIALAAVSVIAAGATYAGYMRGKDESDPAMTRELTGAERASGGTILLLEGAVFALSARHGFESSARCRELLGRPARPPPSQPPTSGGAP